MKRASKQHERAVVIGVITLEDVLLDDGSLQAPFNLPTFDDYCRSKYVNESLDFYRAVNDLKSQSGRHEALKGLVSSIYSSFVEEGSPLEINISAKQRSATMKAVQKILNDDNDVNDVDLEYAEGQNIKVFDEAMDEVLRLMDSDVWPRFQEYATLRERIGLSREIALWWRQEELTFREFFSFPSPVNLLESRLNNLCSSLLILLNFFLTYFFDFPYVGFYIVYGFLARSLCGPRLDPQAFFTLFVARPFVEDFLGLGKSSFHPGAPFRFAQVVGFTFAVAANVLYFVFDQKLVSYIVWACFYCAAFLAAATGICLACLVFTLLCKFHIIKGEIADSVNTKYVNAADAHHTTAQTTDDNSHESAMSINNSSRSNINSSKRTKKNCKLCTLPPN